MQVSYLVLHNFVLACSFDSSRDDYGTTEVDAGIIPSTASPSCTLHVYVYLVVCSGPLCSIISKICFDFWANGSQVINCLVEATCTGAAAAARRPTVESVYASDSTSKCVRSGWTCGFMTLTHFPSREHKSCLQQQPQIVYESHVSSNNNLRPLFPVFKFHISNRWLEVFFFVLLSN